MNYHFSSFGNPLRWLKNAFFAVTTMYGGSGGGAPANTSSQVTTSNIPDYMKPYAKAMLGGAMGQAFQTDSKGNITGTRPYVPYGVDPALYDAVNAAKNDPRLTSPDLKSKDPDKLLAAQNAYNDAVVAQQQAQAALQTGVQDAASKAVAGFSPLQQQVQQNVANMQMPGQFAQATNYANQAAQGSLGIAGLAPGLASQAQGYGATAADIGTQAWQQAQKVADKAGTQADMYGAQGAGYGSEAARMAQLGYEAQQRYAQQATSPDVVQAYMSPYVQASLAPQLQQLAQQTGIQSAQQQAAATSAGAFGGTRSALQNALVQQAGNLAAQQALGQGYNQAYQNAIQSLQFGSNLGIAGLQAGTQAKQAGIQGAQTGLQGVGQQINAGQLGLAGAQAAMQGQQIGLQGVQGAVGANQLGLQGYGQAGQQATNLANIGGQELQAQQGIYSLQNQIGGQQQQQQQNIINQAMQNYQQEQQYPYQQYSFLSNLIRGLPMQSQTQQTYQAAPNPMSQMAGLGVAGLGMYNQMNGMGYSDIRTKDNIKAVGRLKNGLTQYEFNYRPEFGDPSIRYRGVMAQEVEQIKPEAVGVLPNGYKYVNYDMIGTRMEMV